MDFRGFGEQDHQPLVAALVFCYNQARFVIESLESVRRQTYKNIQLIIIDDASSDDSAKLIRQWIKNNNIICTFIAHEKNMGICKTMNDALLHAKGKYVSQIASDDIWMPEKIQNQVKIMEGLDPSFGVVYSDALRIDEKGVKGKETHLEIYRKFFSGKRFPEGRIFSDLLNYNFVNPAAALIRMDCYNTVGLYDENLIFEDLDMWLRISQQYNFAFSPFISAMYRKTQDSFSRKLFTSLKCDYHSTQIIVYAKCYNSKFLKDKDRRLLKAKLLSRADILYRENYAGKKRYLYTVMSTVPGPRSIFMYLCALIGLNGFFYQKSKNALSRLKKCVNIMKTTFVAK